MFKMAPSEFCMNNNNNNNNNYYYLQPEMSSYKENVQYAG